MDGFPRRSVGTRKKIILRSQKSDFSKKSDFSHFWRVYFLVIPKRANHQFDRDDISPEYLSEEEDKNAWLIVILMSSEL
jgi:hypothetical protein